MGLWWKNSHTSLGYEAYLIKGCIWRHLFYAHCYVKGFTHALSLFKPRKKKKPMKWGYFHFTERESESLENVYLNHTVV